MNRARLVFGGPLSPKLQAASAALDDSIERKDPTLESVERAAWIEHLVRLFRIDARQSRQSLYELNALNKGRYLPALGWDVKKRLEEEGLIDKEKPL